MNSLSFFIDLCRVDAYDEHHYDFRDIGGRKIFYLSKRDFRFDPETDAIYWSEMDPNKNLSTHSMTFSNYMVDLIRYETNVAKDSVYADLWQCSTVQQVEVHSKLIHVEIHRLLRKVVDCHNSYKEAAIAALTTLENYILDLVTSRVAEENRQLVKNPIPVQLESPDSRVVDREIVMIHPVHNTFRNAGRITDRVYERVIKQLFAELKEQKLIGGNCLIPDFTGLFWGTFHQKVNWLGSFQQLKYLINGLVDQEVISNKRKWLITVTCFTKEGDAFKTDQVKDTGNPASEARRQIANILTTVRETLNRN